jgi:hypothetical protein
MTVPELDVLVAAMRWLNARGIRPVCASISKGSEAGRNADRERLLAAMRELDVPHENCRISPDGPDLVALGNGELWVVECKGEGAGVGSTQRNNFDRALSSAVSYYGTTPYGIASDIIQRRLIALALPATERYKHELKRRVGRALRERLDMWVLLLEPGAGSMTGIAPNEEYSL